MLDLKISVMTKYFRLRFGMSNLINTQLKLKIPHNIKFETSIIFNCIHQTKSEAKIYIFAFCLSLFKALFLKGLMYSAQF